MGLRWARHADDHQGSKWLQTRRAGEWGAYLPIDAAFRLPFGLLMRKHFEKGKSLPVSHRKALCLRVDSPGRIIL